ncbi:MAG: UDP-glucose 6-dehydrogenase, partial [Candidatus Lambdaproteobacteria bacterium RIFOXYD12_FULL_49_8]
MKVTVFGSGYVGLVAGACFAESGNDVICADIDPAKIDLLNKGGVPIFEPGLTDLIKRNKAQGRISFTTDLKKATLHGQFCFIAVGTPPDEDGSADLKYVLSVAKTIASYMEDHKIIIDKSTVPVGTADKVRAQVQTVLNERGAKLTFDIVSNPEFLKEGAALDDFMKPDRVVVGVDNKAAGDLMTELYHPFMRRQENMIIMDIKSAEMTKYAANSMLATKISFMNEIANLCDKVGASIDHVRRGIGSDQRIGHHFLFAGAGYGGSCFPKDVQALIKTGNQFGESMEILKAVEAVNYRQKAHLLKMVEGRFGKDLAGKKFALWGLSFKPQTDDMREAPSLVVLEGLLKAGAQVRAYDPEAIEETKRILASYPQFANHADQVSFAENDYDALPSADALILVTEWNEFRRPDFERIKSSLKVPLIFDGRNLYDPERMVARGFEYYSI